MSAELKEALEALVDQVNKKVDLAKLRKQYAGDEDRTLLFRVRAGPDSKVDHGFVIESDKLRMAGSVERPTVTYTCDEETFWQIALRKKDFNWAFATRRLTVTGVHFLRDFLILSHIFEDIRGQLGV